MEWERKASAAAKSGNLDELKRLYGASSFPSLGAMSAMAARAVRDMAGMLQKTTPLMVAVCAGHAECVEFLAAKYEITDLDESGVDAVSRAAAHPDTRCLEILAARLGNSPRHRKSGYAALCEASKHGNAQAVGALLDFCDDSLRTRKAGATQAWTAMMLAIQGGRIDCVKLLAPHSILDDCIIFDEDGYPMSPMMLAHNFRDDRIDNGIHGYLTGWRESKELRAEMQGSIALAQEAPRGSAPKRVRL